MNDYNGWLISNNILKRSAAVFGHFMLGYVLAAFAIGIVAVGVSVIIG